MKFDYVVSSLSPEFVTEVRDLLLHPPEEIPYEVLKAELTKWTSASEQRRIQELFSAEELGDRTPLQVLQRIQQLLGNIAGTVDPTLLRELFLQCLPSNVWMVITPSAGALNLDQLAQLADCIVQASPTPTIAATNTTAQLTDQVSKLKRQLEDLSTQMKKGVSSFRHPRSWSPGPRP